jgi:AAA domain (dynein-related subfamily)
MTFKHFVQLISIGLQARIPMHMTGFPGVGKTEFTKSLEGAFTRAGIKCKVIILVGSIREPQDFGGFPVSTPDGVRLLPMAWARDAREWAQEGHMVIVFLDELTTVPPTTQAAMLRLLTENVCGELQLPDYEPGKGGVVYLCASNAVEWAAGGQDIQAPMANRLWHGEFPMDHETWCEMMVSDFPAPTDLPIVPPDYLRQHHKQRALIAAYVKSAGRDSWLAPPDDPVRRSGPWASGRTWYLASRFLAAIEAVSPGNRLLHGAALAGLVGDQALPFLEYAEQLNLPDPESILKDPRSLVLPDRTDRAYAICYSLVGAVLNHKTPERWEAAMIALGVAGAKNADIPTAAARTLCDKRNRPEGDIKLPPECRPFYDLMQAANLLPRS